MKYVIVYMSMGTNTISTIRLIALCPLLNRDKFSVTLYTIYFTGLKHSITGNYISSQVT